MSPADHLTAADVWLLDRVFQPIADRLGERSSAFDVGLSLQLGAVVFDSRLTWRCSPPAC